MLQSERARFDCARVRRLLAAVLSIGTRSNWASGCARAQFVRHTNALHLCATNGVWRVAAALGAFQGADELLGVFKRAALYELLSGLSDQGALSARVLQDGARRRLIIADATSETLYDAVVPSCEVYETPLSALRVLGQPTEQAWLALVACLQAYSASAPYTSFRQARLLGAACGLWLYLPRRGAMSHPYKCRLGVWTEQPFAASLDVRRLPLETLDNPDAARQVRFAAGARQAFAFVLSEQLCLWQDNALLPYNQAQIEQMLDAALAVPNVGLMTPLDVAGRFVFAESEVARLYAQIAPLPKLGNAATAIELKFADRTCIVCAHSPRGVQTLGSFEGRRSRHFEVERLLITRSFLQYALRRVKKMRAHEAVCAIASCRHSAVPIIELNGTFHLPL